MSVEFSKSETRLNLMRAFAGESQARNRYTFAAGIAEKSNLYVVEAVFKFTADQEKEHAEIFYNHLKELNGESLTIEGGYPVNVSESIVELLKFAENNEYEEFDNVYKSFGDQAKQEGFLKVASDFHNIALIEKEHGDRFKKFRELLENGKLFVSDSECKWICLNCGHILTGKEAPENCPVCSHNKGYFIRYELAPYTSCN